VPPRHLDGDDMAITNIRKPCKGYIELKIFENMAIKNEKPEKIQIIVQTTIHNAIKYSSTL